MRIFFVYCELMLAVFQILELFRIIYFAHYTWNLTAVLCTWLISFSKCPQQQPALPPLQLADKSSSIRFNAWFQVGKYLILEGLKV